MRLSPSVAVFAIAQLGQLPSTAIVDDVMLVRLLSTAVPSGDLVLDCHLRLLRAESVTVAGSLTTYVVDGCGGAYLAAFSPVEGSR